MYIHAIVEMDEHEDGFEEYSNMKFQFKNLN